MSSKLIGVRFSEAELRGLQALVEAARREHPDWTLQDVIRDVLLWHVARASPDDWRRIHGQGSGAGLASTRPGRAPGAPAAAGTTGRA